jgi:hypothetical protein
MLDAFTGVLLKIFLDLAPVSRIFIDQDTDLTVRACHRSRVKARQFTLDIKITDLAEAEQPLVESSPLVQPAAMAVV